MKEEEKEEEENITKTRRSRESSNDYGAANGVGVGVAAATVMANNNNNNKGNYYNYKFWVLAAIVVLALWSMFTGSVTLKLSSSNLTRFSSLDLDHSSLTLQDLDVLEVEEREKVVRRMWEVYTHSSTGKVPRFWSDAFHAAYEHLVSDVPSIRDAAVSEIAKMSIQFLSWQQQLPIQLQSESNIRVSSKMKQAQERS